MMNVMMVVEVGVVDVRAVRVLQVEYNNIAKGTSKKPNAHSEKPGKPMIGPGFEQIMKWVTNILIWISFLL